MDEYDWIEVYRLICENIWKEIKKKVKGSIYVRVNPNDESIDIQVTNDIWKFKYTTRQETLKDVFFNRSSSKKIAFDFLYAYKKFVNDKFYC